MTNDESGVIFRIVEEGYGGPLEDFSNDAVHTIIRYCAETGSISKAIKRDEPAKIREIIDPKTYMVKEVLSKIWDLTFVYKGVAREHELVVEYIPNS